MKITSFAIITILPSVFATIPIGLAWSTHKRITIPEEAWVSEPGPPLGILSQPEWSGRSYIDFTGDNAKRVFSMTTGEKNTDFHLRVSKHLSSSKIYLTNDSTQKQTYLLHDPVGKRGLLADIESKEKHVVRASELQVYVKPPGCSEDPHAQPQVNENAVYEGPNEDHDSEDAGHDSEDKGHDSEGEGHEKAIVEKLSQTGHESGSHVGSHLSEDEVFAPRH